MRELALVLHVVPDDSDVNGPVVSGVCSPAETSHDDKDNGAIRVLHV